jgi:LuxR family transcriptional activator of conjugal transfer of Ti plasmids
MNCHLDEQFSNLVDTLELSQNIDNIDLALREFAKQCGFDVFAFVRIQSGVTAVQSNFPQEWQQRYISRDYFAVDPVIGLAKRSTRPFNWSTEAMRKNGDGIRQFAEEATEFGIRSGFTVPLRVGFGGTSILTLATSEQKPISASVRDVVPPLVAVAYAHSKLLSVSGKAVNVGDVELSPRETICLKWAALGLTKSDTAVVLGLSSSTVRFYLDRVMNKLDARNVTQAASIATARGLIR